MGRFARKAGITAADLCQAMLDAERGLIDADVGGGVIEQPVARAGGGTSGVFRTIILYRSATRSIFVHGFARSEIGHIQADELVAFKERMAELLGYGDFEFEGSVSDGTLVEPRYDGRAIS